MGYFKSVKRRDGEVVPFDPLRITNAIFKALVAMKEGELKDAEKVSDDVVRELKKKYPMNHMLGIEEIQDIVEQQLILADYAKAAKAYILYRQERAKLREIRRDIPESVKKLAEKSKQFFKNPLGEFIYYRSYSRWMDSENRRETWIETVGRYMDFMKENLGNKLDKKEYAEIKKAILNQDAMPSMRLMWSAGSAARTTNVSAYNCSFIAPKKLRDFSEIMYILMCGAGVGFSVEQQTVQKLPQIKRQMGKKLNTHIVKDSKEGWADALYLGLNSWFNGRDLDFDYSQLRQAGARLKTMGGKSSGPGPLKSVLIFARSRILANQGRRLKSIDVHDIVCKIGEVVEMGGVRRSALISLSDLDDDNIRDAKNGQFYLTEPQRSMANNSSAYNTKPSASVLMDEWIALAKSGTGERGIFNRGSLAKQLPERRWKVFRRYSQTAGSNPCISEDTWIMTSNGARQVKDLIDIPFNAVVNGKEYPSGGFFKTGNKDIFEIKTSRGFSFRATDNHKVLVIDYKSRKIQRNIWREIGDLKIGDKLVLHNHGEISWNGEGTGSEGWLLGNLLGDGNIEKSGKANLDYWGITQSVMMKRALSLVRGTVGARSDLVGHVAKTRYGRVQSVELGKLAGYYGLSYGNKVVTDNIEMASSEFYRGFLRGWFDADGSVQGNLKKGASVRLSSSNLLNLKRAQRMLSRLGIISTIYENRRQAGYRLLPDGRGGNKEYLCNADHELIISGENIAVFQKRVNFSDPQKNSKIENILSVYKRKLNQESFNSEIVEIIHGKKENVYDCKVPDINAFDGNGVYLHNCGEIILRSKQFCNLSEVVARFEDTEKSLMKKIRLAVILGTYQSTLTNFPYLSKEWKKNCEEERLLGVSITGQWDCPAVNKDKGDLLLKLKNHAVEVNKEYAKRFGIKQSTSITCVKPSGTVSQLVDASSGLHTRYAPYYIRRVRISSSDGFFKMLKDQKVPYYPEIGHGSENLSTYVLEFPVKAPVKSVFRNDLNALEQLEYWKKVKMNYTEHNPSVTISVGGGEWIGVANWVYENWDLIGGLSFLPKEDHAYELAPYEEITKEQYEKMVAEFPNVDYSQILLYEREDETQGSKELACVSGVCEIK